MGFRLPFRELGAGGQLPLVAAKQRRRGTGGSEGTTAQLAWRGQQRSYKELGTMFSR